MTQKSEFRNSFAERVSNLDWVAGFFDGEGCIYYKADRVRSTVKGVQYRSPDIQVVIGQSGEQGKNLLEEFQKIYGFGKISNSHGSTLTKKTPYLCRLSGKKAINFLEKIEPALLLKKQKAQEVISLGKEHFYAKQR